MMAVNISNIEERLKKAKPAILCWCKYQFSFSPAPACSCTRFKSLNQSIIWLHIQIKHWERYINNNNNINEIVKTVHKSWNFVSFNFKESNSVILYIIWSHRANPWVLDLFYIIWSHSCWSILVLSRKAPIESHLGLHFCKYNLISYCKPLSASNSLLWQYCTQIFEF